MDAVRWRLSLLGAMGLGAVVRFTYLFGFRVDHNLPGDASYYHLGANLLVDGKGFVEPLPLLLYRQSIPAAVHPPAFLVTLAGASLLGFRSLLSHQILCCVLGTLTVGVVGLAGREIAGMRAGLSPCS